MAYRTRYDEYAFSFFVCTSKLQEATTPNYPREARGRCSQIEQKRLWQWTSARDEAMHRGSEFRVVAFWVLGLQGLGFRVDGGTWQLACKRS